MASFRNFLITFLISVLLFGVIGYFTTVFVSGIVQGIIDSDGKSQENGQDGSAPSDQDSEKKGEFVPDGTSYSFLIVLTDYDPVNHTDYILSESDAQSIINSGVSHDKSLGILLKNSRHVHATAIILVKADKEQREYLLCYITPETRVYTRSGAMSLGNVYGNYGINVLKEHVKALTGIQIDYHFVLDGYKMSDVIQSLGRYSIEIDNEIYTYGDYYMSSYNFTAEEKKAAFDTQKVLPDESQKATEKIDYIEELTQPPVLGRALFAGIHELDRETLPVFSNLKECSLEDIDFKGGYILPAVEFYLRKCADMSETDLSDVISSLTESTPYASDSPLDEKPALASDFRSEDVSTLYGMICAIKHFEINKLIYPGNYVTTHDAQIGYYVPTLRTAVEDLIKYR
ncbi:MAG: hypothetical protein IKI03_00910 [Clostridia bacterium]|nr:hypothetical protein [Clostridia bacterium]